MNGVVVVLLTVVWGMFGFFTFDILKVLDGKSAPKTSPTPPKDTQSDDTNLCMVIFVGFSVSDCASQWISHAFCRFTAAFGGKSHNLWDGRKGKARCVCVCVCVYVYVCVCLFVLLVCVCVNGVCVFTNAPTQN